MQAGDKELNCTHLIKPNRFNATASRQCTSLALMDARTNTSSFRSWSSLPCHSLTPRLSAAARTYINPPPSSPYLCIRKNYGRAWRVHQLQGIAATLSIKPLTLGLQQRHPGPHKQSRRWEAEVANRKASRRCRHRGSCRRGCKWEPEYSASRASVPCMAHSQ